MTSAAPGAPPAASADPLQPGRLGLPADPPLAGLRRLISRVATLCWVELRKIRHDRTELYTRAIQPALAHVLSALGLDPGQLAESLVTNSHGEQVGVLRVSTNA